MLTSIDFIKFRNCFIYNYLKYYNKLKKSQLKVSNLPVKGWDSLLPSFPRAGGSGGLDDHRFSNLIGSGDQELNDRGKLKITFARCWWAPGCKARMPRVRFGHVHIINSYFNSTASAQCVMAGFESNLRVENNVFKNVKVPIDLMAGYTAVTAVGNIFTNTSGNTAGNKTAFTPPYSIITLAASAVKADVSANAGATFTGNICGSF
ncbi:hypothetical protein [Flavobacterium sp. FlaQc-47]|uniref:pectate lyase family protein n=1 Tax=Flavobacterium sp. FlaQc-47 TaxID=3374180 RepID=UPI00375715D1